MNLRILLSKLFVLTVFLADVTRVKAASDLSKSAAAFLSRHCVTCHGTAKPKGDVSLNGTVDEAVLLKDRKKWASVVQQIESGEMPPKEKPRPSAAEQDAFVKALHEVYDRADGNAKPDPGRVTARRLNKVEYNNTIRDLLGVDFNASEDFPSDDIGYGFDSIGDVLTLSPVLMERYLAAAETIANRAITLRAVKPPDRHMSAMYLEPSNGPKGRFRPITASGSKGALFNSFVLTMDGEHILRVRCYGKKAGDEPVKLALLMDGKELKSFDVKATEEKKPETLEARVVLPAGSHRGEVRLVKEFKNDKEERTLFIESMSLEGPLDTRPAFHRKLVAAGAKPATRTRDGLTPFVSRAYRRPATKDEIDRLVKLVEAAEAGGESWEAGMQLAVQAVLVSPKFLFRIEQQSSAAKDGNPVALNDYQLASRLSYFLWSSMPDDDLFALAAKSQLGADMDVQVKRMLRDPKAKALVDNFFMQWLQLRRLKSVQPDPKSFPNFNDRVREAMMQETWLFLNEIIREDRSILDLLDGKFTYLNGQLANFYGIKDTKGSTWGDKNPVAGGSKIPWEQYVRVELPANSDRGGLLTHGSVLTVTSNPTRTSPVKRGRWILEQILGTPPPPPPPDVPELDMKKGELKGTLRQRMEQHRANPACANCHAKMDPIGFAFENFDAIGAYRFQDSGSNIDSSGILPDGKKFKGPSELKQILREKKELFGRCLAEKMLIYAIGRGTEHYDKRAIDRISTNVAKADYKLSALVIEVVNSEPFRLRRGGN